MWKEGWVDLGEEVLVISSKTQLPKLFDVLAASSSAICILARPSLILRVPLLMAFLLRYVAFSFVWGYLLA